MRFLQSARHFLSSVESPVDRGGMYGGLSILQQALRHRRSKSFTSDVFLGGGIHVLPDVREKAWKSYAVNQIFICCVIPNTNKIMHVVFFDQLSTLIVLLLRNLRILRYPEWS